MDMTLDASKVSSNKFYTMRGRGRGILISLGFIIIKFLNLR